MRTALSVMAAVVWVVLITACTTAPQVVTELTGQPAGIEIEGIIIRNRLPYTITDVQVLALSTGNFVSCGNISRQSVCSTGFPSANYRSGKLVISWKEHGVPQSTDEFTVTPGANIDRKKPAVFEVLVYSPGLAGAQLIQP